MLDPAPYIEAVLSDPRTTLVLGLVAIGLWLTTTR
jgi:hypothetical protein